MLFISADAVGPEMAGVGIRYWELANILSAHADVELAAIRVGDMPPSAVTLSAFEPHSPRALRVAVRAADLVVCQPQWPRADALAARRGARVVYRPL